MRNSYSKPCLSRMSWQCCRGWWKTMFCGGTQSKPNTVKRMKTWLAAQSGESDRQTSPFSYHRQWVFHHITFFSSTIEHIYLHKFHCPTENTPTHRAANIVLIKSCASVFISTEPYEQLLLRNIIIVLLFKGTGYPSKGTWPSGEWKCPNCLRYIMW